MSLTSSPSVTFSLKPFAELNKAYDLRGTRAVAGVLFKDMTVQTRTYWVADTRPIGQGHQALLLLTGPITSDKGDKLACDKIESQVCVADYVFESVLSLLRSRQLPPEMVENTFWFFTRRSGPGSWCSVIHYVDRLEINLTYLIPKPESNDVFIIPLTPLMTKSRARVLSAIQG